MPEPDSRRNFLKQGAAVAAALAVDAPAQNDAGRVPWYRRSYRWGQTNITEKDPVRYDIAWWRGFWKRTATQAVIVNAGGTGTRYFATDTRGTIFFSTAAAVVNPIPAATSIVQ